VRNWNEPIIFGSGRHAGQISTHQRSWAPSSGKSQMCFAQGSRGGGEGDRENQSDDGLGKASCANFCGVWSLSCEIYLSYGPAFFFEPKSRFHITPQIYITRGRETVINNLRRCGPVKIDCHLNYSQLNPVARYPGQLLL
jgi:hypothetical protein